MSGAYTPKPMETARAGTDAPESRFDGLRAEASAAVGYSANALRSVRDRYREALASDADGPDSETGPFRSTLERLELAERTLSRVWLFLQHGDDSLVAETSDGMADEDAAMRIMEAQEAERSRLAQEIHDGPAQALTNAIFQAEYIERIVATDAAGAAAETRMLRELLRRDLDDIRDFIYQLRPPLLDELGLDGAIEDSVDRLRRLTGLTITTQLDAPTDTLDDQQRTVVLRVTQEALQNVRKHAEASMVVVSTALDDDDWSLEVRDDGRGFEVEAVAARSRRNFGLQFMRDRAALIDARFDVRSRPDGGTVVRLAIPRGAQAGAKENG